MHRGQEENKTVGLDFAEEDIEFGAQGGLEYPGSIQGWKGN